MKYRKTKYMYIKQSIKDPKTINEGIKINEILSGLFGYLQIYAWMFFCCKIQKGQPKSCITAVNIY